MAFSGNADQINQSAF